MAKDLNPKCKQCRRAGEKLLLKGDRCSSAKCAIVKRNFPPGFHGQKGKPRLTDYGQQLNEKQKARRQYNLMEKQFRLLFEKAKAQGGNTGDNFIKLLETRFDNVVYRIGLGESRNQARQMINHGHFMINGEKVNIPSFHVKTGDEIAIKVNKREAKLFKNMEDKLKKKEVPGWLNLDLKKLTAKVLHKPNVKEMRPNFNIQMIIEYYSR